MKKVIYLVGIVLISSFQFSCSKDECQDLNLYQKDIVEMSTGGEEDETPPPPPPPPINT